MITTWLHTSTEIASKQKSAKAQDFFIPKDKSIREVNNSAYTKN